MKKLILIFLIIFTISQSSRLIGQSILTDRPDQSEGSTTVPRGSFQIETGLVIMYSNIDGVARRIFAGPSNLFRVGLIKGLELRVSSQLESVRNLTKSSTLVGISDLQIGAKVELLNRESINAKIAFLTHVLLPTGTKDLSLDNYATINKLAVSHIITDNIGVGYNIGYNYFGEDRGDFVYSLVFGFSMTEKLGIFVEGYGDVANFKDNYMNFDTGLTYLVRNNLQFDFSFGTGINHYMNYFSTGISWNIGGYNN